MNKIVTSHEHSRRFFFVVVDMDRGDQDVYLGAKYTILGPLCEKIYEGL